MVVRTCDTRAGAINIRIHLFEIKQLIAVTLSLPGLERLLKSQDE